MTVLLDLKIFLRTVHLFEFFERNLVTMRVKDCMGIKQVVQATPDTNLNQIAQLMNQNQVGCIPVCKNEKIVGFVTDRDIVTRAIASNLDCAQTPVSDIMNTNIVKTTPDTEISAAIQTMEQNQIRRLPVIQDNKIVGMLSIGDLSQTLDLEDVGHTMECICNQDQDQEDQLQQQFQKQQQLQQQFEQQQQQRQQQQF